MQDSRGLLPGVIARRTSGELSCEIMHSKLVGSAAQRAYAKPETELTLPSQQ